MARTQTQTLFTTELIVPAIRDAFLKLDPGQLIRKPVMFTTAVVAVLLTPIALALLLTVLARHPVRVVTHDRIIAAAWGGDDDPRIGYLRIVIRNLSLKIEAPGPVGSVIANELGVG